MLRTEFKLMVLSNAFFALLYLLWNWNEYSTYSSVYNIVLSTHFPMYIQIGGTTKDGIGLIAAYDYNFGLVILLFAILVNLFLAFKLQKQPNPQR